MKLRWLGVVVALVGSSLMSLVLPGSSIAQDNVSLSPHNLSTSSSGVDPTQGVVLEDYGEICVYCHTPHGGDVSAPLWNHQFSAATYPMYSSPTIDMTIDAQPTGVSLACLSCHDGTVGLDVLVNLPNSFAGSAPSTTPDVNTMPTEGFVRLGTDLRDDHPVSVVYNSGLDPMFNSKAAVVAGGLRLFGDGATDKVQCASCHNPHDNSIEPFLRKSNAASDLCLTCHIK